MASSAGPDPFAGDLAFSAAIHFLRGDYGDAVQGDDPDEYCANYDDALQRFVENVVGPDACSEVVSDAIEQAKVLCNAATEVAFSGGGGREELEMANKFHTVRSPYVVDAGDFIRALRAIPPRSGARSYTLNRRRESRCSQPGRRRGSRRVSSRSAGGGGPGDPDEDPGDPDALKLWGHPYWGPCTPSLLRLLIREVAA